MELIIEQISRSKKLLQRHKVHGPHIAVGRAYDNDVILNDPYISPHHLFLSVNQEGRWLLKDQGSVNGTFVEHESRLNHPRPIRSGEVVSIGKSFLRFIYPDHPVAPAIRLSGVEGLLNWLSSPVIFTLVFCLFLGLQFADVYVEAVSQVKTSKMFYSVFAKLVVLSLLPMLFAFLARLFKHDARVLTQTVVWYSFFILFSVVDWLGTLISFNSTDGWIASAFADVVETSLMFALLWVAFYVAFHQRPARRLAMVGGLTCGIVLLGYLYQAADSVDFQFKPVYNNILMAPEFAIAKPVTIDEFIARSESIFDQADKQAVKKEE